MLIIQGAWFDVYDKDGIFLISLNEKYTPIKVSENDRLDIFGKVLGKSDASAITGHCR